MNLSLLVTVFIVLVSVVHLDAWGSRGSGSSGSRSGSRSSSSRSSSRSSSSRSRSGGWGSRSSSRSSSSRSSSGGWGRRSSSRSSSSRSSSGGWGSRLGWGRSSSSSSSKSKSFPHDQNKKQLTNLYNSKVTKVESVSRPLSGILGKIGIKHTGVVATTQNGGKYLIHKGPGYGKASSTVVVDAKHMSNAWKTTGSKATSGKTISDLMKAGHVNKPYGILPGSKICWGASKNIMKEAGKGRRKREAC